MRALLFTLAALTVFSFAFLSCQKKTEEFKTDRAKDYFPSQIGKYIIYRIDSTVFTQAGRAVEVHSYLEKNVVDAQINDSEGRPSYRFYRYLTSDLSGNGTWFSAGSYFITPLEYSVEVVENNMRSVKLIEPIKEGTVWKGNRFISDEPYKSIYQFSGSIYNLFPSDWEFEIKGVNEQIILNNKAINNVVTVKQIDDRFQADTVNVVANKASIPVSKNGIWLRGNATETIILTAAIPSAGQPQRITIYNRTNRNASLNGINIPATYALTFEFNNNSWGYPGPLNIQTNTVTLPADAWLNYIFGSATDSIKIDASKIDTTKTKSFTIYNRTTSSQNAYLKNLKYSSGIIATSAIPPGYGRSYEFDSRNKVWRFYNDLDVLLSLDPYKTDLPFGNTTYSMEKYAKGIGLVYQELIMWEYQPDQVSPYKVGFGIKRSLLDHN